jgi:hypothetical protein
VVTAYLNILSQHLHEKDEVQTQHFKHTSLQHYSCTNLLRDTQKDTWKKGYNEGMTLSRIQCLTLMLAMLTPENYNVMSQKANLI